MCHENLDVKVGVYTGAGTLHRGCDGAFEDCYVVALAFERDAMHEAAKAATDLGEGQLLPLFKRSRRGSDGLRQGLARSIEEMQCTEEIRV